MTDTANPRRKNHSIELFCETPNEITFGYGFFLFHTMRHIISLFSCLLPLGMLIAQIQGQVEILGPAGSEQFGRLTRVLSNGNFVVTDPLYDAPGKPDAGAVYLYRGSDLALISVAIGPYAYAKAGNGGVFPLGNGNFLILSNGMALLTWVNGASGLTGTINSSNSLSGVSSSNIYIPDIYIKEIINHNYLICVPEWSGNKGAVIWANDTMPITGTISSTTAFVGSSANDYVGTGVYVLPNGRVVLCTSGWDNGSLANVGAVTWINSSTGITGTISATNSLTGNQPNDYVGLNFHRLSNGNALICSPHWDRGTLADAGAATWINTTTGLTGTVSAANSLVGSTAGDMVSWEATPLTNGNYVVRSPHFSRGAIPKAGVATWGNGATGIVGEIDSTNSLMGSQPNDSVGTSVTALTNGNYVVNSPNWHHGSSVRGAATWGNGTTGIVGSVQAQNSLIGKSNRDLMESNIYVLTNGNYVVGASHWDKDTLIDAGAATWGNGATGITGIMDGSNSVTGTYTGDSVGLVMPLSNGNYVLVSPFWNNFRGMAMWCNGNGPTTGTPSSANAMVGTNIGDWVGNMTATTALSNGNYTVGAAQWAGNRGFVAWCDGATGRTGTANSSNALIGNPGDLIGQPVTYLTNGNYIVASNLWNGWRGMVTLANGQTGGLIGIASAANAIVGSTPYEQVGYFSRELPNGDFSTNSQGSYNGFNNAGAVRYCSGTLPQAGPFLSNFTVTGRASNDVGMMLYHTTCHFAIVPHYLSNRVTILYPEQEISLAGNTVSVGNGDTTPSAADGTDMGSPAICYGATTQAFTLYNKGLAPLTISNSTSSDSHFAIANLPAGTVAPGDSVVFTVTFDPDTIGPFTGMITISNNDPDEGIFTFSLQGQGIGDITLTGNPVGACQGSANGQISGSATGGMGGYWFSIDNGLTFLPSTVFDSLPAGTYQLIAQDSIGCVSAPVVVQVDSLPLPLPAIAQNGSLLTTGSFSTYQWQLNGTAIPGATSATYPPVQKGLYTVFVTGSNGCSAISAPYLVEIQFTTQTSQPCAGALNGIIVFASTWGGGSSYAYSINGGVTYQPAPVFAGLDSGQYVLTVLDSMGITSDTISLYVSAYPLPAPTITQNGPALSTGTFVAYQWLFAGQPISGATSQSFTATQNGTYTVTVVDGNGCNAVSAPVTVTGVSVDASLLADVRVFPNPTSGILTISSDQPLHGSLYTLTGEKVMTVESANALDLSILADGVYLLHLQAQDGSEARIRVVKMQ